MKQSNPYFEIQFPESHQKNIHYQIVKSQMSMDESLALLTLSKIFVFSQENFLHFLVDLQSHRVSFASSSSLKNSFKFSRKHRDRIFKCSLSHNLITTELFRIEADLRLKSLGVINEQNVSRIYPKRLGLYSFKFGFLVNYKTRRLMTPVPQAFLHVICEDTQPPSLRSTKVGLMKGLEPQNFVIHEQILYHKFVKYNYRTCMAKHSFSKRKYSFLSQRFPKTHSILANSKLLVSVNSETLTQVTNAFSEKVGSLQVLAKQVDLQITQKSKSISLIKFRLYIADKGQVLSFDLAPGTVTWASTIRVKNPDLLFLTHVLEKMEQLPCFKANTRASLPDEFSQNFDFLNKARLVRTPRQSSFQIFLTWTAKHRRLVLDSKHFDTASESWLLFYDISTVVSCLKETSETLELEVINKDDCFRSTISLLKLAQSEHKRTVQYNYAIVLFVETKTSIVKYQLVKFHFKINQAKCFDRSIFCQIKISQKLSTVKSLYQKQFAADFASSTGRIFKAGTAALYLKKDLQVLPSELKVDISTTVYPEGGPFCEN